MRVQSFPELSDGRYNASPKLSDERFVWAGHHLLGLVRFIIGTGGG
ncbi:MAG: hypothetical protein HPY52_04750 [Firmicutes bacterium]|nr:hypothetical protein [Bacillota bacterium]